jgi:hypothetical protein
MPVFFDVLFGSLVYLPLSVASSIAFASIIR